MKFLCIPCDTAMTLQRVTPPDRGSLSVVYACPECGYEMAMLTNAYETQIVQSLGVRIGPKQTAADQVRSDSVGIPGIPGTTSGGASGGACPFTAMIPSASTSVPASAVADVSEPALLPVRWTSAAEARLANIPAFVRPMAKTGIERFARERGASEVDETVLDAAREFFGM